MRFTAGEAVLTRFGKGIVRETRNNGRVLVDVDGRALVLDEIEVSAVEEPRRRRRSAALPDRKHAGTTRPNPPTRPAAEVDFHGLTVEEAVARAERVLNDALLEDVAELRFIHGRSGGRVRAALHALLRAMPAVRHFRLDPHNEGVTVIRL